MPWLPLYLYGDDHDVVLELLNSDPEVAFIIADGAGRWKAVAALPALTQRRTAIWHIPSGPLPLLPEVNGEVEDRVPDPWHGWAENRAGADSMTPYFGAGHPGIIWLNVKNNAADTNRIGISSFEWIGHRYAILGDVVDPATEKWWKRVRGSVRRLGSRVPRGGPAGNTTREIYALAGALRAFHEGWEADDSS